MNACSWIGIILALWLVCGLVCAALVAMWITRLINKDEE